MPLTRQAYSSVSSDGTNGILTAMGVRLVDLITASGIDMDSVEKIGFYQGAEEGWSRRHRVEGLSYRHEPVLLSESYRGLELYDGRKRSGAQCGARRHCDRAEGLLG